MIKRVSDLTKINWDNIWDMNVYTFFNYLNFDITYTRYEQQQIEQWRNTH